MKINKLIYIITTIAGFSILSACIDESVDVTPQTELTYSEPTIAITGQGGQLYDHGTRFDDDRFASGARFEFVEGTLADSTYVGAAEDTLRLVLNIFAGNGFSNLTVSRDNGSPTELSNSNTTVLWEYILKTDEIGTEVLYTFAALDANGLSESTNLRITTNTFVAPSEPEPRVPELPYTNVVLKQNRIIEVAAGDFSTSPQHSLRTGLTYTTNEMIADPTLSENIDLMFDYDFGGEAGNGWIMSPASFNVHFAALWNIGEDATDVDQQAWTQLNETTIVATDMTAEEFNALAAMADGQAKIDAVVAGFNNNSDRVSSFTSVADLNGLQFTISEAAGTVVAFKTQNQMKGLILINLATSAWVPHVDMTYLITEL